MGWELIPWYSITDDFDTDFGVDEWHGHNAFIRDGDKIFRTYFINSRGAEAIGTTWSYLDMTALGRQEQWEDSPDGYPQTPPYAWWNYHDAYGERRDDRPEGGRAGGGAPAASVTKRSGRRGFALVRAWVARPCVAQAQSQRPCPVWERPALAGPRGRWGNPIEPSTLTHRRSSQVNCAGCRFGRRRKPNTGPATTRSSKKTSAPDPAPRAASGSACLRLVAAAVSSRLPAARDLRRVV